jgi:shikimate kinase
MNPGKENIFLIGLMGSGKTTVGRALARRLQLKFVDSDQEIEARTGVSVRTIFELEGESGFREREALMINELTQRDGIVLATGGGAVIRQDNRAWLKSRGIVVYLRARPEDLFKRTRHDRDRPLLQTPDPLGKIKSLLNERQALYEETADIVLDTGDQGITRLVGSLEQELAKFTGPTP